MKQPIYKGQGNHSVNQLEGICEQYKEYCHQKQLEAQELHEALSLLSYEVELHEEAILSDIFNPSAEKRFRAALSKSINALQKAEGNL